MQYLLWITYLPGALYLLGYPVVLIAGLISYGYMQRSALLGLIYVYEGSADLWEWFTRPARKAFLIGPLIFWLHSILLLLPGINILSSFYLGWWAVLDYYDYKYLLGQGPYYSSEDK